MKIKKIILALISFCFLYVFYGYFEYQNAQLKFNSSGPIPEVPIGIYERLAAVIRIPTVSHQDRSDLLPIFQLHQLLKTQFPLVHQLLSPKVIADGSLVFEWKGTDLGLSPVLLTAHLDVVPSETNGFLKWQQPPFSGYDDGSEIWGRGALDDKSMLMALLESVEFYLKSGHKPKTTIYLAFGHDEEVGGTSGAKNIAEYFKQKNIRFSTIFDEGGFILDGAKFGVEAPVALVGVAEKGYASYKLTAQGFSGHSSMPPKKTSIDNLISAIEKLNQLDLKPKITKPLDAMLKALFPHMGWPAQLVLSVRPFTNSLLKYGFSKSDATRALVTTSRALTLFHGGIKENVLPAQAEAVVNFRLLPGLTVNRLTQRITRRLKGTGVKVELLNGACDPSSVSSSKNQIFKTIGGHIKKIWPEVIVTPFLLVGGTDSRHYQDIADQVYRFSALDLQSDRLALFHGTNERITKENYKKMVQYHMLLINGF